MYKMIIVIFAAMKNAKVPQQVLLPGCCGRSVLKSGVGKAHFLGCVELNCAQLYQNFSHSFHFTCEVSEGRRRRKRGRRGVMLSQVPRGCSCVCCRRTTGANQTMVISSYHGVSDGIIFWSRHGWTWTFSKNSSSRENLNAALNVTLRKWGATGKRSTQPKNVHSFLLTRGSSSSLKGETNQEHSSFTFTFNSD